MEKIETEKVVTLRYSMRSLLPDGSAKEHPEETLTFIFGVDRQVPSLERALEGAAPGARLTLTIPPADIYGDHDPALIREIPRKGLITQRLREGGYYRQMKMGSLVSFKVIEIREDSVLADFNRPMAGISVTMDIEVLDLRDASKEEIEAAVETQMKRNIGCA